MKHETFESLESYLLGRTAADPTARIEEHLLICEACRQALLDVEAYVTMLRRGLVETEGVIETHATPGGIVVLRAYPETSGWVARVSGLELDVGRSAETQKTAVELAQAAFSELFPGHECGASCRTS